MINGISYQHVLSYNPIFRTYIGICMMRFLERSQAPLLIARSASYRMFLRNKKEILKNQ